MKAETLKTAKKLLILILCSVVMVILWYGIIKAINHLIVDLSQVNQNWWYFIGVLIGLSIYTSWTLINERLQ